MFVVLTDVPGPGAPAPCSVFVLDLALSGARFAQYANVRTRTVLLDVVVMKTAFHELLDER